MKVDPRSYERNLCNCVKKPEKNQDFNGVWTRDLAIPVRRSNQLSYEATDVWSRSIVELRIWNSFDHEILQECVNFYRELNSSKTTQNSQEELEFFPREIAWGWMRTAKRLVKAFYELVNAWARLRQWNQIKNQKVPRFRRLPRWIL